jgi:cyclophilin family peptidyl-prolyl cis-trans isomerase/protein-disulfide isomerase
MLGSDLMKFKLHSASLYWLGCKNLNLNGKREYVMQKRWMVAGVLLLLFLPACAAATSEPPLATEALAATQPVPTSAATMVVEATQAVTEPEQTPTQVEFTASGPASCTVVSTIPDPDPAVAALFSPITEDDWVIGPPDAAVTIIEYSDFQCPYCAELETVLVQLRSDFPGKVRHVFRHYPLNFHPNAFPAARAAEAAGVQGAFDEMKNTLFAQQDTWVSFTESEFDRFAVEQAEALGLDVVLFEDDYNSEAMTARVQAGLDEATTIGLPGTPFLLINDAPYQGPRDYFNLATIIRLYVLEEMQYSECPERVVDQGREYIATIETEKGKIVVELFPREAPFAVNNFVFLAREGWYDDIPFHRVLPGFVAQAGDPSGTGYGSPGYAFSNEVTPELRFDRAGLLAMANAGPEANGSQFFLTYAPQPTLDGRFTIFGRVIAGMDVLEALQPRDPQQGGALPEGTRIQTITIEEN